MGNKTMNGWAVIASNNPQRCVKTMKWYAAFDRAILYIHVQDLAAVEAAFQGKKMPMPEIWTHSIPGPAPMGAIRYYSMERAQREMGYNDWVVLVDDDLRSPRLTAPNLPHANGKGFSYPNVTAQVFKTQLDKVANAANGVFPYFTAIFNARGNNGYKPSRPFKAVYNWSGLFGFFKQSANPFNPKISVGADLVAAFQAVHTLGRLAVLRTDVFCAEWTIDAKKYLPGTPNIRSHALDFIVRHYPHLAKPATQTGTGSGILYVKLQKKVRDHLKVTVPAEYR